MGRGTAYGIGVAASVVMTDPPSAKKRPEAALAGVVAESHN